LTRRPDPVLSDALSEGRISLVKLEPVYLVARAPDPAGPAHPGPSRRSFLLSVVGAFVAGTAAGIWAGTAVARSRRPVGEDRIRSGPNASGLSDLDRWALEQARGGAELEGHFESFLLVFHTRPPLRAELRPGVEELVAIALDPEALGSAQRRDLAGALLQAVELLPVTDPLRRSIPRLTELSR
jgi:hypothetical protein